MLPPDGGGDNDDDDEPLSDLFALVARQKKKPTGCT
jgi:hypothetical protein